MFLIKKLKHILTHFTNRLTFESHEPITKIQIYSILGQLIKETTLNNSSEKSVTVDLTELQTGNYFAKIHCEEKIETIKVIKY